MQKPFDTTSQKRNESAFFVTRSYNIWYPATEQNQKLLVYNMLTVQCYRIKDYFVKKNTTRITYILVKDISKTPTCTWVIVSLSLNVEKRKLPSDNIKS